MITLCEIAITGGILVRTGQNKLVDEGSAQEQQEMEKVIASASGPGGIRRQVLTGIYLAMRR